MSGTRKTAVELCSVCLGQPLLNGAECICHGYGTAAFEKEGLRLECIRLQRQVEEGTAINERLCVYLGNVLIQYMDFRDLLTKLVEEAKGGDKPLNYYEMLPRWVGLMKHRLALNATTGDVKALNYELKRMKGEKTS